MKALKTLLANRCSTCIIVVCDLKVLLNQDQFQRIQNWHSVDLKFEVTEKGLKITTTILTTMSQITP